MSKTPIVAGMKANVAAPPSPGQYPCPAKCPLGVVGAREYILNPHGRGPAGELWCPGSNSTVPRELRR